MEVINQNEQRLFQNRPPQLISWLFMNRLGQWVPYSDHVQLCIEDCYQQLHIDENSPQTTTQQIENRTYIINVKDNTQQNIKTGVIRKIMRVGENDQLQQYRARQKYIWQFLGDQGWRDYDSQCQNILMQQYYKYKSQPTKENKTINYQINLEAMTQFNTKYQTVRKIRIQQVDQNYQLQN